MSARIAKAAPGSAFPWGGPWSGLWDVAFPWRAPRTGPRTGPRSGPRSGVADGARAARERAERRGRLGEAVAALWLQLKGYQVLAHRVRTRTGEIDLVARRRGVVAVVEVKTRRRVADGYEAVSPAAQARIARAAAAWLEARPPLAALDLRFDLVIVAPWSRPIHARDAWRPAMRL